MELKGSNWSTFVKQHGIVNIVQHINTEHKVYNIQTSVM
jgi:hypothetical protein